MLAAHSTLVPVLHCAFAELAAAMRPLLLQTAKARTLCVYRLQTIGYVRSVKINPSVFIAHNKALEDGNAKYLIRRAICKTYDTLTNRKLGAREEKKR